MERKYLRTMEPINHSHTKLYFKDTNKIRKYFSKITQMTYNKIQ